MGKIEHHDATKPRFYQDSDNQFAILSPDTDDETETIHDKFTELDNPTDETKEYSTHRHNLEDLHTDSIKKFIGPEPKTVDVNVRPNKNQEIHTTDNIIDNKQICTSAIERENKISDQITPENLLKNSTFSSVNLEHCQNEHKSENVKFVVTYYKEKKNSDCAYSKAKETATLSVIDQTLNVSEINSKPVPIKDG